MPGSVWSCHFGVEERVFEIHVPGLTECDNDVVCKLIDAIGSDMMNFTAQLSKHICLYTLKILMQM